MHSQRQQIFLLQKTNDLFDELAIQAESRHSFLKKENPTYLGSKDRYLLFTHFPNSFFYIFCIRYCRND
ncbi:hypothetical protein CJ013_06275 [Streptococcus pneumoniae]|nr:hypothetical protein CJ013_06275 [Streptococcus pneumoniae]